jgi:hypothetical protein
MRSKIQTLFYSVKFIDLLKEGLKSMEHDSDGHLSAKQAQ